jgi:dephospho-CoA kinase
MARPYCVGLTGGIGSGKSTVAQLFADLGADIVDTDVIARDLSRPGGRAMPDIVAAFGAGVVAPDGGLDRAAMRALAFEDAEARARLNAILHPLIHAEALAAVARARAPYVILVVPLLAESAGYADSVDRVLVVDCAEATQLARAMRRDGADAGRVEAIMAAQAARAERLAIADDVVHNDGAPDALPEQVASLHARYLANAAARR